MEERKSTVYKFDELPEDAQRKALENLADINVEFEWWESTYEDAKSIGLKITGFDIDRGARCDMEYIDTLPAVLKSIMENHGENCETYKTAETFRARLLCLIDSGDTDSVAFDDAEDELRAEFLQAISEDYRIILQKEFEYLTSEQALRETIEANDYDFTIDGKID